MFYSIVSIWSITAIIRGRNALTFIYLFTGPQVVLVGKLFSSTATSLVLTYTHFFIVKAAQLPPLLVLFTLILTVKTAQLPPLWVLNLCLLVSSADNLCKQFGPRSGLTKRRAWSGSNLFDTQMVFLNEFFKNKWFWKNQQTTKKHAKLPPRGQRVNLHFEN